jgi:hypothetical protein
MNALVPISIAISIPFLVIAFSVNGIQDSYNRFKREARAAALVKAESYSEIYDPSSWAARKAQLAWFIKILRKWMGSLMPRFMVVGVSWLMEHTPRPPKPIRKFFGKFRWWRIKRSVKRLRRAARKRGLWRKDSGSSDSGSYRHTSTSGSMY